MTFVKTTLMALAMGLSATAAQAAVITLDFEGLGDLEAVGDFYNGGAGEDFGISFSDNALALVDRDAGGTGNIANEPTPDTVLVYLDGAAATLNFAAGFEDGFSFFYSALISGSVDVYSGLDGTGDLLASIDLAVTPIGPGDPNGDYSVWNDIGVDFDGTAMSVDFGGTANFIVFDNITFGSVTPGDEGGMVDPTDPSVVPLPAGGLLLLSGLALLGVKRRKT